jgi:hypothetical protein
MTRDKKKQKTKILAGDLFYVYKFVGPLEIAVCDGEKRKWRSAFFF